MENFVENIKENIYGYARVSTQYQNEDRQIKALKEFGVTEENLFIDKKSGKDFEREEYQLLKKIMKRTRNNVLVIKSIDRLGRNYNQILEEWKNITKELNTDIVVLDMPLLDTRNKKNLLGNLISDIVLELLSFVAEEERKNIRQRQREGIDIALKNGVKFGRKPIERPETFEKEYLRWKAGKQTAKFTREQLNLKPRQILHVCKRI